MQSNYDEIRKANQKSHSKSASASAQNKKKDSAQNKKQAPEAQNQSNYSNHC
ncbi:hypothetical protein [Pseudoflavonifractor sp. 524-17]|uniref:hypothetical protein n=1 Tax=Pseudoflavonifractor sp. 524-17 TaxID=2304577 RepID=UPI001379A292|nr:hypothetical protein [Pseudoflavonifractor sp. 524-17]